MDIPVIIKQLYRCIGKHARTHARTHAHTRKHAQTNGQIKCNIVNYIINGLCFGIAAAFGKITSQKLGSSKFNSGAIVTII